MSTGTASNNTQEMQEMTVGPGQNTKLSVPCKSVVEHNSRERGREGNTVSRGQASLGSGVACGPLLIRSSFQALSLRNGKPSLTSHAEGKVLPNALF